MSNRRRIVGVLGCCVVAAATPFVAGLTSAIVGVVPLGCAIWLLARSEWSLRTRLIASMVVLAATFGLVIAFLILATSASGD